MCFPGQKGAVCEASGAPKGFSGQIGLQFLQQVRGHSSGMACVIAPPKAKATSAEGINPATYGSIKKQQIAPSKPSGSSLTPTTRAFTNSTEVAEYLGKMAARKLWPKAFGGFRFLNSVRKETGLGK